VRALGSDLITLKSLRNDLIRSETSETIRALPPKLKV